MALSALRRVQQHLSPTGSSLARLKPHLPTLVFLLSLAIVAVLRYLVVRQHLDMGQDMANYLITMNTLFGHDVTGTGLLRPPLIAIPLKLFTLVFGNLAGGKLLGVTASVAMGIPVYLIAKRVSRPWIAVAVSVLFVLTPAYANMLSWGYITMFGVLFTMLSAYFFMLTFESKSRWSSLLAGLFGSLVIGFHQLTAAFFVPLCALLVAALFFTNRRQGGRYWVNPALGVLAGVVLSLPYVPVYIHLVQMQSGGGGTSALTTALFSQFTIRLWYLPWTWAAVLGMLGALASLLSLWRRDRNAAVLLATLFLFPLLLLLFNFPAPFVELNRRANFFLYVPIWATTGYILSLAWVWRPSFLRPPVHRALKPAITVLLLFLLVYGTVVSQKDLGNGLNFYAYLDETRWDAVQWVKASTPTDAVFACYPEHLGWWIEGEAPRTSYEVTDRDMEASDLERERAFVAELLMSRNRGMENGCLRVATTYPYTGAPGNPAVGLYVGGRYHDLLMFDDAQTYLTFDAGPTALSGPPGNGSGALTGFSLTGDGASMQTVISYHFDGAATITQTVTLDEGSQHVTVVYAIESGPVAVTGIRIPVLFCISPDSVSIDPRDGHFELVQGPDTQFTGEVPVTTLLSFETTGALLQGPGLQEDRIELAFDIQGATAAISMTFDISTGQEPDGGPVAAYEAPRLIRDNGIDYLAIDFKPHSALWSDMPLGLQDWLDACPYYTLVCSEGDVRIYEVVAAALP
jgi:hypothetical protein